MDILKSDGKMRTILHSDKFIQSRRQPANLKNLLTRAKFTASNLEDGGSNKCKDKRCGTCNYIKETTKIQIKSTGRSFKIKTRMNCKSKNVLYIIDCNGCGEQYIGKTHDKLAARVRVHKQQINHPEYRKIGVSRHIDECCSTEPKFHITPFFKITDDKRMGNVKENYFIQIFRPPLNNLKL